MSMLDELVPSLPKSEARIDKSYKNCEQRKRFIHVNKKEFSAHLEKAKSDLTRIENDYNSKAWDWVVIKAYYAIHHAINALLIKVKGFYSKDHFCSILALKHFELLSADLYLNLRKIHSKFSDFTGFDVTYSLRKIGQYNIKKWKLISKSDAESVYSFAKELISFIEEVCYDISN